MNPGTPRPPVDLLARAGIREALPDGFVPRCPNCRYNLRGLAESRCPECGSLFSMNALIADWHARQNALPSNIDFGLGAVLTLLAFLPADLREPASLFWKAILLPGAWTAAGVWIFRHREELQDPDEGHRVLWIWAPCASTAAAISLTPVVNGVTAAAMLVIAAWVGIVSWRRSPLTTAVITSLVLAAPAAIAVLAGLSLAMSGVAGSAQGHHWSPADYPGWYWRGTPGRTRGMPNDHAVAIGRTLVLAGLLTAGLIAAAWALLARRWMPRSSPRGR